MNKLPIITCGSSYMTPANSSNEQYANCHFSEIIAQKFNTDLIVLSNGGCSNFSIALQVEQAINWSPTPMLILVGSAPFDRIDIPIVSEIIHPTINDQMYHIPSFKSYRRTSNPKFISTALRDFFDYDHLRDWRKEFKDIDSYIEPVNNYFEFLYNFNLKRSLDEMIIYSYYHKLHESKIPYFICNETFTIEDRCPWLYKNNSIKEYIPQYISKKVQSIIDQTSPIRLNSPFHTTNETQIKIAELIFKTYEENINSWR